MFPYGDYSDIVVDAALGIFSPNTSGDVFYKNKAKVVFRSQDSIDDLAKQSTQLTYHQMGASSLSNIFYPFTAGSGTTFEMPAFPSGTEITPSWDTSISTYQLTPFKWDPDAAVDEQYDRFTTPSGDSLNGLLTGEVYPSGSDKRYRFDNRIRGVGHRLPMVGVGWGYTTDGDPYPTSSGDPTLFKGNKRYGYQVDPNDYVAAPIDIRYDVDRGVWTMGGTKKHRHLKNTEGDGGPAFASFFADSPAEATGLGYQRIVPHISEVEL